MNELGPSGQGVRPLLALSMHVVIVLALAALYIGVDSRGIRTESALPLVGTVLLIVTAWLIVSWWMSEGTLLNPYGLFLIASLPFHVGYAFLRAIGQEAMVWLQGTVTELQILHTLTFVTACYATLHLGALLVSALRSTDRPGQLADGDGTRVYHVGWLLLAISIVPMLLRIKANVDVVMSGGYSSLFEGGGRDPSSGAQGLLALISDFYLPGVMFLMAGSRHRPLGKLISLVGLAIYSGSYLFMGFRAFSLIPIAVSVWVWHRCIRRLPILPVALTGGGLFLIVAPLIRRIRDMSGIDRLSFDVLWEAYAGADNPVLALIAELAGSVLTISFTSELVPDVRPFEMGYGYLRALANAIPIWDPPDSYGYAGSWLAWHVTPQLAVGGFGLGFSFMAEAYLNFGWIGGVAAVGAIGLALVGVQKWADNSGDPARLAFVASFLPILIFFARGESLSITRPILWYGLLPHLLVLVLRSMDRRLRGQARRRQPPAADRGPALRAFHPGFPPHRQVSAGSPPYGQPGGPVRGPGSHG